jgi:NADH dehydrogenase FAD-containing subunit
VASLSTTEPHLYGASSSATSARELVVNKATGQKTVVIVGASFGGLAACHELADDRRFKVILIDQREYFEYTPGVLRLFCQPGMLKEMARQLPRGSHELVIGQVTSTSHDHVVVGGTRRVDLDYLILATGADYRQPITPCLADSTLAARSATWHREAARVCSARSVLILGGGAVGTELAAEIVCHFPGKRVTLVDALPNLVPLFPRKTIDKTESWFRERGVELLLGELLEKWDDSSCTTQAGRVIEADIVFVCFGMRCNSQSVAKGDMASCLGKRQEVQVNDFFQVGDNSNVFAIGDVMAHPTREIKQAYYAEMNGHAVALNVKRHYEGRDMIRYPEAISGAAVNPLVYVVSLGRYDGSLGFNNLVVNGSVAALMKWIIEWTKVAQMEGRPIGIAIWAIGDALTFWLSRVCLRPAAKDRDS